MPTTQRVVRTAATTLTHTFVVDETPTDSSTTPVTVTVTDANGTVVQSGNATHAATGLYTVALTPQANLARLSVAWSATINGAPITETDPAEVVGARFFTLLEGRASDDVLANTSTYPTAKLADALLRTENECEEICDRGFVPHYGREIVNGTGSRELTLTGHDIRTIRAVRVATRAGQPFIPLTTDELAALVITEDGTLIRTDWSTWTDGINNIIVEYEYGLDCPPPDLLGATLTRFRTWAQEKKIAVPDRATSYTTRDGTSYRVDQPGAFKTGIPTVDAVYARYSLRDGAGGQGGRNIPVGRPMNLDPQRYSIFHGGVR